jgi:hypothetical protein
MNEARRRQLEIFRAWTPQQRLRRGMELTALCLEAREARLRRQFPDATEKQLRQHRLAEFLNEARLAHGE